MNLDNVIKQIIELPTKYYKVGDKSMHSLLRDTGYFETYEQISEKDIYKALIQHPEFLKEWLQWSENKRTDEGWYFNQSNGNKYLVGYLSRTGTTQNEYTDASLACAVYIKHEIENLRLA